MARLTELLERTEGGGLVRGLIDEGGGAKVAVAEGEVEESRHLDERGELLEGVHARAGEREHLQVAEGGQTRDTLNRVCLQPQLAQLAEAGGGQVGGARDLILAQPQPLQAGATLEARKRADAIILKEERV